VKINSVKIIGLTGGIGSGKTTVANMFQELGVPIYIADVEAKKLMQNSKVIKRQLVSLLGAEAYINNELNKPIIAEIIFKNKKTLEAINAIVHPKVGRHFKKWVAKQSSHYVIKETAILFENGAYQSCDEIITVIAPEKVRIQRVISRDESSVENVKAVINNQWNDDKKVALSQYVIVNDDLSATRHQVKEIHQKILKSSC